MSPSRTPQWTHVPGSQWLRVSATTPIADPVATRVPTGMLAVTGSTELRRPSSCVTVRTGRSTTTPA